jgi:hypothetical protein
MLKVPAQLFTLAFVVFFSFASVCAHTQGSATNTQDQTAIDRLIQEILTKAAELSGGQAAKVRLLTKEEKEAEEELSKTSSARERAVGDLGRAVADVARAQSHIRTGGAQSLGDYGDYELSVGIRAGAEAEVNQLGAKERDAQLRLEIKRSARTAAEHELSAMESRRTQQKSELVNLYRAWRSRNSDETFKGLTGYLTYMATTYNATSDVEFLTEDSMQNQTGGARINYESELDRKNNVPIKATNCTTVKPPATPSCVKPGMPQGWYYIWSVRGEGRVTSDKNFYTRVEGTNARIIVQEYH